MFKFPEEYKEMIAKGAPHLSEYIEYQEVLANESDRGAVLVTASMLDDVLLKLLQVRLIAGKSTENLLTGYNAPLGSFSARIDAAMSVGVISEEYWNELHLLRKIRNKLAHAVTKSLSDQDLIDQCNCLKLCLPDKATDAAGARMKYWMSAACIMMNLIN